jgi:hypothetical protein
VEVKDLAVVWFLMLLNKLAVEENGQWICNERRPRIHYDYYQ